MKLAKPDGKLLRRPARFRARALFGPVSCLIFLLALLGTTAQVRAEKITVAVASNFAAAMRDIATAYEAATGHKVVLAFGATGKHYAQIVNGAPFDAFFAADSRRPELLEQGGHALPGSRFAYARGRLALWSSDPGLIDAQGDVLSRGTFAHLALANPRLAPYGRAAQQVLEHLDLLSRMAPRLIRGENIGQTFQFVRTGAAELGFVAHAQIRALDPATPGSFWLVPERFHSPIEQQAVQLRPGAAVRDFLAFVKGDAARGIIRGYGYDIPGPGGQ